MLLAESQCDELYEISNVSTSNYYCNSYILQIILRDKNIEVFDAPYPGTKDCFKMEELANLECIYASHNLIRDVFGIC